MAVVYLAFGSNLGDRREYIDRAKHLLEEQGVIWRRHSSLHETVPVGGPEGQGLFLNGVSEGETALNPEALLRLSKRVEKTLGRQMNAPRNSPREIDIDILFYDDLRLTLPDLTIPHPRMDSRPFVLEPLKEIAPERVRSRSDENIPIHPDDTETLI